MLLTGKALPHVFDGVKDISGLSMSFEQFLILTSCRMKVLVYKVCIDSAALCVYVQC